MITYIHKQDGFIEVEQEFTSPFDSNVGYTIQDYEKGQWIKLNDEQLAFKEEHPNASMLEVFNMKIEEVDELQKSKISKFQELDAIVNENSTFKLITTNGIVESWGWDLDKMIKLCEAAVATNEHEIQKDGIKYNSSSLKTALYQLLIKKNNLEDLNLQYKLDIENCKSVNEVESIQFDFDFISSIIVDLV